MRNSNRRIFFTAIAFVFVAGASFLLGMRYASEQNGVLATALFSNASSGNVSSVAPTDVDWSPLWKVWNVLKEKYVPTSSSTPVTDQDMMWGAVKGLAASMGDPYTVFFPPKDSEVFAEDISGNFEGVGMEIGMRNSALTVIAPLKDTPAERAGIHSGDVILKIDGAATDKMTIDEAVKHIRGPRGTHVELTIAREGESDFLTIDIVRDVIDIPTIETKLRDDGIFVVSLYNFSAVATQQFQDALREFEKTGSDKLILDLRGNPGGYLDAAIDMASYFLPAGEVVVKEDFGGNIDEEVHRSKGFTIFGNGVPKTVILIDKGSASASEILAGALSEHGVATLVGEQSFGKGSVQELVDITPKTSLKVTIARWLTPNGISISEAGLTPDVVVPMTADDAKAGKDPQMDKAVEILLGK